MLPLISIALLAFLPMLVETFVSARNERVLRRLGAIEPVDDVIGLMRFAYPLAFAVMLTEGYVRAVATDDVFMIGLVVFLIAKTLKYWAIGTLGTRWTFRVLVPRDSVRITAGPYRFMRHPNYVAVLGELVGTMVMARAWVVGPIATIGFGLLMLARVRVEERALTLESRR